MPSGFEATYFQSQYSNEIVISFAGTYPKNPNGDFSPLIPVDIQADLALAAGILSDQLKQAADYYLQVKASAPEGATITFTGHSLGGGLASLMAVMFGESAYTFDQAPFLNSAKAFTTTDPLTGDTITQSVAQNLRTYLAGKATVNGVLDPNVASLLAPLDAYIAATDPGNTNPIAADTLAARSLQVSNINTQGEFLSSWYLVPSSNRIGTQGDIADINNISGIDLHSQALLTAMLQSGDTPTSTATDHTLGQVSFKLTDLLKMIFDKNLYSFDTDKDKVNFLEHLVRHQTGGVDGVQAGGDAMVTRFTSDLWKLAQDGGLTMSESATYSNWNNVSKALIAFAMQKYYEENNPNITYGTELFTDLGVAGLGSNGITFDIANVSQTLNTKIQAGGVKYEDLVSDIKGYQYFQNYIDTTGLLSSEERTLIKSMLPVLRDWYVQAGASGMLATDTLNRGAFMLGGSGSDALVGGTAADLLVGNAGADLLQGGKGNDTLLGGTGNDAYVYQTGDGLDTILDSDGNGSIAMDGAVLAGGGQFGDSHVHRDAFGHTYTDVGRGLVVDGNIFVQNWQAGNLGVNMTTTPQADAIPATTLDIKGDPLIHSATVSSIPGDWAVISSVSNGDGTVTVDYYLKDADGNPTEPGGPSHDDTLKGTSAADHIISGAGVDHIYATQGGPSTGSGQVPNGDLIEAGGGDGLGTSNAKPGAMFSDYVEAGAGADHIYANSYIDTASAIAQGNTTSNQDYLGLAVLGGGGNDVIAGSAGRDYIAGGTGSDLLIGGAGNDVIEANSDGDAPASWSNIPSDDYLGNGPNEAYLFLTPDSAQWEAPIADTAGDVIYAGEGSDYVAGSDGGNDVIFGENGNDALIGFLGNDVIMGGAGNDTLYGDWAWNIASAGGNDYLDGGAGNDIIYGNEGDDILTGGAGDTGNDTLNGGAGQDTYIYNLGDGIDTIDDTRADRNILRFGAGVKSSDIKLHLGSLMLDLGNGDLIHINNTGQANGFNQNDVFNSSSIGSFEFADGSTLSVAELLARGFDLGGTNGDDIITGTNTTDRIYGYDGNDTLAGGAGNDTLAGGAGNDAYLFNRGDGQDVIADNGDSLSTDTLQFGADILQGDVIIRRTLAGDLELTIAGGTDTVTIQGWYTMPENRIERIVFGDGAVLTPTDFASLPIIGTAGDDVIAGSVLADTIAGGAGNDILNGGLGNDTYVFNLGDGADQIIDAHSWQMPTGEVLTDANVLRFGTGITASMIAPRLDNATRSIILDLGNGDSIDIRNLDYQAIQTLQFADGSTLAFTEFIAQHSINLAGSNAADTLVGTDYADAISGNKGDDTLNGEMGNDTYLFNLGDGADRIVDSRLWQTPAVGLVADTNLLRFGAGITPDMITSRFDSATQSVTLDLGNGDSVEIGRLGDLAIQSLQFTDGTSLSPEEFFVRRPFNIAGTDAGEILNGTPYADAITGGHGNDTLSGGIGNDTYLYNAGDGADAILDSSLHNTATGVVADANTLSFGAGITASSITSSVDNATGQVTLNLGNGDSIRVGSVSDLAVQTIRLADGTSLGMADLLPPPPGYSINGSVLSFGAGITPDMLTPRRTSYMDGQQCVLDLGNGSSIAIGSLKDLIIHGIYDNNPFDFFDIQTLQFADGTTTSAQDFVMQRGLTQTGAAGADTLYGEDARNGWIPDRLQGGAGNDTLVGGGGSDIYVFNRGDGADTIKDGMGWQYNRSWGWMPGGDNTLVFGAGIAAGDIFPVTNFATGQLVLNLGNPSASSGQISDSLNIGPANDLAVQNIQFADGTMMTMEDFLSQHEIVMPGTNGADSLNGTRFADRLQGLGGNDNLIGDTGQDVLDGGTGNDHLDGGAGSDTYIYNPGDGADTIVGNGWLQGLDPSGQITQTAQPNTLSFGAGITSGAITPLWDSAAGMLTLDMGNGDSIAIGPLTDLAIQNLRFSDGTSLAIDAFLAQKGVIQNAGTPGNDVLVTLGDGQPLQGLGGDDTLYGSVCNDTLVGGAGNDTLVGSYGNDTFIYNIGDGADTIGDFNLGAWWQGGEVNTLSFGAGITTDKIRPVYDSASQSIVLDLGNGDSINIGSPDNPAILNLQFADGSALTLDAFIAQRGGFWQTGTAGVDLMDGTPFADRMEGLADNDNMRGNDGNDTLVGGAGNDALAGGAGNDTYIFNRGDGGDSIYDGSYHWVYEDRVDEVNTLVLGGGITASVIDTVVDSSGNVTLDFGMGDSVCIQQQGNLAIQQVQFADGTILSMDQVLLLHNAPAPGSISNQITTQDQPFSFIVPPDAFGNPSSGANLVFSATMATGSGQVPLPSWLTLDTATGAFGGVPTNWDVGSLNITVTATDAGGVSAASAFTLNVINVNDAPTVAHALGDQSASKDQAFSFTVPANTFDDVDFIHGDHLIYNATLADGSALPSWLAFDAATGTFTGLSSNQGLGNLNVAVTATDTGGLTATSVFALNLINGNNAPTVAVPLVNQSTLEDQSFTFTVPANTFNDVDFIHGDALTCTATLANGSALPGWLTFNAATQTFSGTPTNWDVTTLNVTVKAIDTGGMSADSSFALEVLNVNDAPVMTGTIPDQSAIEGQALSFMPPGGTAGGSFLDDATDTGTPDQVWPNYDNYLWGSGGNDTYTFARGDGKVYLEDGDNSPMDTVQFTDVSPADITVTQDQWGTVILSVNGTADSLTLYGWLYSNETKIEQVSFADGTVWGVNEIQSMLSTSSSAGSDYTTGTDGNDTIRALSGDDGVLAGAGDDVVVGGSGNDYLDGGSGSDLLSGGSGADVLVANRNFTDGANDLLMGGAGDDELDASISNDLLIGGQGNDWVGGYGGNDVILFNRGDGNDQIAPWIAGTTPQADTVSLGGGINYADLSFSRNGDDLILNTGNGESLTFGYWFSIWFDARVANRLQIVTGAMADYDPNSADPLLNKRIQQFDFLALASRFEAALAADPSITTWQLAPYLADFSLGGSDTSAIGGDTAYLYGMNGNLDGLSEAELRAQLNDASFGTANQTLTRIAGVASLFNDVDFIHGDHLTYRATLADGSALPGWLAFDATTGAFSGTPGHGDAGTFNLMITATDTGGLSASAAFNLDIASANAAPTAQNDAVTTDQNNAQTIITAASLLANDTDPNAGDVLALSGFDGVTANGNAVTLDASGNLVLDIGDRYQSLAAGQEATDSFSYTIADPMGATSTATVDVTISGLNDAPVVANALAGQATQQDAAFRFTIPSNTFADIDRGDMLAYGATLVGGTALPSWLTFDALTGAFSGTPTNWDVGNLNVQVTATDTGGLTASSAFALEVINVNDPPVAAGDTGAVMEDGGAVILSAASLLANDTDPDLIHGDVLNVIGVSQAASGAVVSFVNGSVQYDIGNLHQSLSAGQTATDTFSYTIADTAGATSTATVTMTITGVNDAPVTADDAAAVQEDVTLSASGNVLANDSDVDQGTVLGVADAGVRAGSYGSLTLSADGSYTYALDNARAAVQGLMAGQVVTETFSYQATDGLVSTPATLTVTITGTNDAPVAHGDTAATNEDAAQTALAAATLLANDTDADVGDTMSIAGFDAVTALGNSVSKDAAGNLVFDIGNRYQSLAVGQSVTDTFNYTIADSAAQVSMTIAGVNDAPVTADDAAAVREDVTLSASGNVLINDSDVDQGTVLGVADAGIRAGSYGSLTLSADGSYTYALDNASLAVQSLAAGQAVTETFGYQATDGLVVTSSSLTVTITGTNDAPLAAVDTAAVQEDVTPSASGNVLANDSDVDQGAVLSVADAGVRAGSYGSLTLSADGSYTYALDNASLAVQSLAAGQAVTETFGYQATDGLAATPSSLTVTITGTNDAPVVAVPLSGHSTLEDQAFSFHVPANTFTDIDHGDMLTFGAGMADGSALPDWLKFDALTQTFSGVPGNRDVANLNIAVTATDTGGLSATSTFALDVINVNDAPIVANPLADQHFDEHKKISFVLPSNTFDDWDIVHGDSLSYSATLADGHELPSWLKFDAATRTFSGKPEESGSWDIRLTATDMAGASVSQLFSLGNKTQSGDSDSGDHNHKPVDKSQDQFFVGSKANDIIHTGNGADTITFNRGGGQDSLYGGIGTDNTLILGGGIRYADLALSKVGNDLILEVDSTSTGAGQAGEQITLKNWYDSGANYKSVLNLQVVADATTTESDSHNAGHGNILREFDFIALVNSFDQARGSNDTYSHWSAMNDLLTAHLESGTAVLSGDLTYQYGTSGMFAGMSLAAAQNEINDPQFGPQSRTLRSLQGLQGGGMGLG